MGTPGALAALSAAPSFTTRWPASSSPPAGSLADHPRPPSTAPRQPASADCWRGTWRPSVVGQRAACPLPHGAAPPRAVAGARDHQVPRPGLRRHRLLPLAGAGVLLRGSVAHRRGRALCAVSAASSPRSPTRVVSRFSNPCSPRMSGGSVEALSQASHRASCCALTRSSRPPSVCPH